MTENNSDLRIVSKIRYLHRVCKLSKSVLKRHRDIGYTSLTCAYALLNDGRIALGFSYCHPKDQFNKSMGRSAALLSLFAIVEPENDPYKDCSKYGMILTMKDLMDQQYGYRGQEIFLPGAPKRHNKKQTFYNVDISDEICRFMSQDMARLVNDNFESKKAESFEEFTNVSL